MTRNPDATRRRLFDAAVAEFGDHGIAGARIDRIAKRACANKQLIYAYYGGKQELFDQVVTDQVARFHESVQLDPADVPGFAGAAFDFFTDNPTIVRLATWHSLEPAQATTRIAAIDRSIKEHVRVVGAAQKAGLVDTTFAPEQLMAMIFGLARTWVANTPEFRLTDAEERKSRPARRAAVVEATRRLVTPR